MIDIYVYNGVLQAISRSEGDVTGIPPGASIFSEDVWSTMCKEAGGESALIESIGVKDIRGSYGQI